MIAVFSFIGFIVLLFVAFIYEKRPEIAHPPKVEIPNCGLLCSIAKAKEFGLLTDEWNIHTMPTYTYNRELMRLIRDK